MAVRNRSDQDMKRGSQRGLSPRGKSPKKLVSLRLAAARAPIHRQFLPERPVKRILVASRRQVSLDEVERIVI
jgi:hypothetical protein